MEHTAKMLAREMVRAEAQALDAWDEHSQGGYEAWLGYRDFVRDYRSALMRDEVSGQVDLEPPVEMPRPRVAVIRQARQRAA